jgi:hypothetical protein
MASDALYTEAGVGVVRRVCQNLLDLYIFPAVVPRFAHDSIENVCSYLNRGNMNSPTTKNNSKKH